jgi:hypothetical protein
MRSSRSNPASPSTLNFQAVTVSLILAERVAWFLARVIELQASEFAVPSTRLILKVGLVWRYTTELLLAKVETIGVERACSGAS